MKLLTFKEAIEAVAGAAVLSAVVALITTAIASALSGDWNWRVFGSTWIPLGVLCFIIFLITTVRDNRREMYADNE